MQTTLLPFLTLRSPRPESIRFVTDFSRRTGDLEVLSKPDIHLLALTYELELERNGGDWRIRRDPGQKGLNGKPPSASTGKDEEGPVPVDDREHQEVAVEVEAEAPTTEDAQATLSDALPPAEDIPTEPSTVTPDQFSETVAQEESNVESKLDELNLDEPLAEQPRQEDDGTGVPADEDSEDDSDGWITPSNLKAHQAKDAAVSGPKEAAIQETLRAALLTSDFAMQNVALRINLKYVSITMITHQAKFTNTNMQSRLPIWPLPHSPAQDLGLALLWMLRRFAQNGPAILPQVRPSNAHARVLQHRRLRRHAAASEKEFRLQQARQRLQRAQAHARQRQRQAGECAGRRQEPLGVRADPGRGSEGVHTKSGRGPPGEAARPDGRGLSPKSGHGRADGRAWKDPGWGWPECECEEEAIDEGGLDGSTMIPPSGLFLEHSTDHCILLIDDRRSHLACHPPGWPSAKRHLCQDTTVI